MGMVTSTELGDVDLLLNCDLACHVDSFVCVRIEAKNDGEQGDVWVEALIADSWVVLSAASVHRYRSSDARIRHNGLCVPIAANSPHRIRTDFGNGTPHVWAYQVRMT